MLVCAEKVFPRFLRKAMGLLGESLMKNNFSPQHFASIPWRVLGCATGLFAILLFAQGGINVELSAASSTRMTFCEMCVREQARNSKQSCPDLGGHCLSTQASVCDKAATEAQRTARTLLGCLHTHLHGTLRKDDSYMRRLPWWATMSLTQNAVQSQPSLVLRGSG